jgi:Ni/Co efflux regulator RcnB
MTTDRKRRANQRNAQRSTGPRTQAGKARSKQNAWKHGLAVPISVQPHLADLIDFVANCLAREAPSAHPRDQEVRAGSGYTGGAPRTKHLLSHPR